jgi:hypothetical protein
MCKDPKVMHYPITSNYRHSDARIVSGGLDASNVGEAESNATQNESKK